MLAVVAVGGYLYAQSAREAVPPSGAGAVLDAAELAAADATLLAARTSVESFFLTNGTYAGATVPTGVVLVGATAASYCLQTGSGTAARHVAGPGATPAPGPCQAP